MLGLSCFLFTRAVQHSHERNKMLADMDYFSFCNNGTFKIARIPIIMYFVNICLVKTSVGFSLLVGWSKRLALYQVNCVSCLSVNCCIFLSFVSKEWSAIDCWCPFLTRLLSSQWVYINIILVGFQEWRAFVLPMRMAVILFQFKPFGWMNRTALRVEITDSLSFGILI